MNPIAYVAARDGEHAVALLAQHGAGARILAGGTDLLVELKAGASAQVVIDISRARDLAGIALTDEGLRIGAVVTHGEIMGSPLIRDLFPALVEAAHSIGAVQTRNLGTIGGNLVTCVPSMDSGPALVALEAVATVLGPSGRRRIALTDLFVAPRKTSLGAGELLAEIVIPSPIWENRRRSRNSACARARLWRWSMLRRAFGSTATRASSLRRASRSGRSPRP